jgi:hypothetical protein
VKLTTVKIVADYTGTEQVMIDLIILHVVTEKAELETSSYNRMAASHAKARKVQSTKVITTPKMVMAMDSEGTCVALCFPEDVMGNISKTSLSPGLMVTLMPVRYGGVWTAAQIPILEIVSSDSLIVLSKLQPSMDPFDHFSRAVMTMLPEEKAFTCGVLMKCVVVGLVPSSVTSYKGCGDPECEGLFAFGKGHMACPMCPRSRSTSQRYVEYAVRMTSGDITYDFLFRGRRALEWLSGPWSVSGTVPNVLELTQRINERFTVGDEFDILPWARFSELEGTTILGTPKIHVVCFKPHCTPWPVILVEPIAEVVLNRSLSTQYGDGGEGEMDLVAPVGLVNQSTTCATNAVLQCLLVLPTIRPFLSSLDTNQVPLPLRNTLMLLQTIVQKMACGEKPGTGQLAAFHSLATSFLPNEDRTDAYQDALHIMVHLLEHLQMTDEQWIFCRRSTCPRCAAIAESNHVPYKAIVGLLQPTFVESLRSITTSGGLDYMGCVTCQRVPAPLGSEILSRATFYSKGSTVILTFVPPEVANGIPHLHEFKVPPAFVFAAKTWNVVATILFSSSSPSQPGHWRANVKHGARWWLCSDAVITESTPEVMGCHTAVFATLALASP